MGRFLRGFTRNPFKDLLQIQVSPNNPLAKLNKRLSPSSFFSAGILFFSGILLLVTLFLPAAREAHVLCLRLVTHATGKTVVQGQPSGCIVYTIPNIRFTEQHQRELSKQSNVSIDDYVLASSTGSFLELEFPPAITSTNHPLLQWTALQLAWIAAQQQASSSPTNTTETLRSLRRLRTAREFIQLAQASCPTNGGLWIAEASVDFAAGNDEAALAALWRAATNRNWDATTGKSFLYISTILNQAGLSKVDAAIAANYHSDASLSVQGIVKKNIERLLISAVQKADAEKFSNLLQLLVELRKADWIDKSFEVRNTFRMFTGSIDVVNVMADKLGRNRVPELTDFNFEIRQQIQRRLFEDYLNLHADARTASSFFAQKEAYETERKLRRQLDEANFRPMLWSGLCCTLSGGVASLMFTFLILSIFFELPFLFLRKRARRSGEWPRDSNFWTITAIIFVLGVIAFTSFWNFLGVANETGFSSEHSSVASPFTQSLLTSILVCGLWLGVLLIFWRYGKKPVNNWPFIRAFGAAYLIAILAMAYYRSQLVETIAKSLL
jgi:hypothetical protein